MAHDKFRVSPVKHYDGARYPGAAPQAAEEPGFDFWKFLFCLVLVMGLSLGLMVSCVQYGVDGCPDDSREVNGKCVGPEDDCEPGVMRCDTGALMVCDEDGEGWTGQACETYCQDMYGQDAYSTGCEADAADPCGCQYDITPGVVAECTPGDFMCLDDGQVSLCEDNAWEWTTVDCDDFCQDLHGPGYISMGCEDEADEACNCQYGMIDGGMTECSPGDLNCQDEDTLQVCDEDSWSYTTWTCQDWCEENYGPEYIAGDCDDSQSDNPCNCEYGIVDGEPVP